LLPFYFFIFVSSVVLEDKQVFLSLQRNRREGEEICTGKHLKKKKEEESDKKIELSRFEKGKREREERTFEQTKHSRCHDLSIALRILPVKGF